MAKQTAEKHSTGSESDVKPRRDFLKTIGAVSAGGAAALLLPNLETAHAGRLTAAQALADHPTSKKDEKYWKRIQRQFGLDRKLIYMNTGTEGSMPKFVLKNMRNDFKDFAAFPMDAVLYDQRCTMFMDNIVPRAAAFLGADDDEIVMTTNTTEGLGWIANGLNLQPGDEVVTHLHFPPYNAAWFWLRERNSITVTEVELPTPTQSAQEIIDAFEQAITPNTKVMSFCHINYTTGLRMPIKQLCELARLHNIVTVVDGAHAIGMLNYDLHDLGVDFYACSPHKWLCAPPGTGVLYMRKELQEMVTPTVSEQYRLKDGAPIVAGYFQIRGQQTTPAHAGVIDVMDFQDEIGKDCIEERVLSLSGYLKEKIIEKWGADSLMSPQDSDLSTGLVSFNPFESKFGGLNDSISSLFYGLWQRNIITRCLGFQNQLGDSRQMRVLRFSTHLYNNFDQIDTALEELEEIIETL
jgi:selenocysteine lyase/cysteine desulfurase